MKNILTAFVLLAALLISAETASAGKALQFGYVDTQKVLNDMPEIKAAEKKMEEYKQKAQQDMMKQSQDLQTKYDNYMKQKTMMTPEQQKTEEAAITGMQQQLQMQQQQLQNDLLKKRDELMRPITDRIKAAVEAVAKKKGMTMVMERPENASIILYADDSYDITYAVMEYIKKNKKK